MNFLVKWFCIPYFRSFLTKIENSLDFVFFCLHFCNVVQIQTLIKEMIILNFRRF